MGDPGTLIRLVRRDDGALDGGAGQPGRGAWVCRSDAGCFDRAAHRNGFTRALRGDISTGSVGAMRARLEKMLGWEAPTA